MTVWGRCRALSQCISDILGPRRYCWDVITRSLLLGSDAGARTLLPGRYTGARLLLLGRYVGVRSSLPELYDGARSLLLGRYAGAWVYITEFVKRDLNL